MQEGAIHLAAAGIQPVAMHVEAPGQGCELVELYTSPDDPNLVYLWEKWRTRADQEKYLKWRTESGSMAAMGAILDGPAQFLHLDHHADI